MSFTHCALLKPTNSTERRNLTLHLDVLWRDGGGSWFVFERETLLPGPKGDHSLFQSQKSETVTSGTYLVTDLVSAS